MPWRGIIVGALPSLALWLLIGALRLPGVMAVIAGLAWLAWLVWRAQEKEQA